MSWFTDLAGRAEALLNQVDQAAATSLLEAGLASPSPKKPSPPPLESGSELERRTSSPPFSSGLTYEPTAQPSSPVGRQPRSFSSRPTLPEGRTPPVDPKISHLTPTSRLSTWGTSSTWSQPPLSSSSSSAHSIPTSSTAQGQDKPSSQLRSQSDASSSRIESPPSNSHAHSDSTSRRDPSEARAQSKQRERPTGVSTSKDKMATTTGWPAQPHSSLLSQTDEQTDSVVTSMALPMGDTVDSTSSPALLEIDLIPTATSTAVGSGPVGLGREEERVEVKEREKEMVKEREEVMVKESEEEEDVRVLRQKMSNLELENNLLRQEAHSLSEEMSAVLQRNKKARESRSDFSSHL